MASSMPKPNKLLDKIRQKWILSSNEELVRQILIEHLVEELLFPKELIAIEKKLSELPHLNFISSSLPERRVDVMCYTKKKTGTHLLHPLLLIECKAESLNQKALHQALGYNHYIQSSFIAVVAKDKIIFTGQEANSKVLSHIPAYPLLIEAIAKGL